MALIEEYEPEVIPGDPINNIIYTPTPINSVEDLDEVYKKLDNACLKTNRDDIYDTKISDFLLWVQAVHGS